ncbi:hypothetical protein NM688_g6224 [Phlebia brevispora]|uniref:Uncharacterized protein n=1 Tax=Phlebia brevispora TaxID=194682 RepID=A0ACC1SIH3_9APHY|nr:hypothetical protein NM688_g6224 [Phlebia brevispora]
MPPPTVRSIYDDTRVLRVTPWLVYGDYSSTSDPASHAVDCPVSSLQYLCKVCFQTENQLDHKGMCRWHRARLRVHPKNLLIIRHHGLRRYSESQAPPETVCKLFSVLPHADVYAIDTLYIHPESYLLLLECPCERCIQINVFGTTEAIYSLHYFFSPNASFLYDADWNRSLMCKPSTFSVEGDIQKASPIFPQIGTALTLISPHSENYVVWARILTSPLPAEIARPHWARTPATAADIPTGKKSEVSVIIRAEAEMIAPAIMSTVPGASCAEYSPIVLRGRKDLLELLGSLAQRRDVRVHERLSASVKGELDIIEQLNTPWIHNIFLQLRPKLDLTTQNTAFVLENAGPFPRGSAVSSIHGSLPRRLPYFSSGIQIVHFTEVHFKSFEHLLRLVRELPSLRSLKCTRVTWDTLSMRRTNQRPAPTSFLARDDPLGEVTFSAEGCTDDRAIYAMLPILLGQTRQDILDQNDADALCTIFSAGKCVSGESRRQQDEIVVGPVTVRLTPRAGVRQRRRAQCIMIVLDMTEYHSWVCDWSRVDRQLEILGAVHLPFMPWLDGSPRHKLIYFNGDVWVHWRASLIDGSNSFMESTVDLADGTEYWRYFLRQDSRISMRLSLPVSRGKLNLQVSPNILHLDHVHFKAFDYLSRLIREMSSLTQLYCERVTWDSPTSVTVQTVLIPSPTSTIGDRPGRVEYRMSGCTDDNACFWLAMLSGQTTSYLLDDMDAHALFTTTAAWRSYVEDLTSERSQDEIICRDTRALQHEVAVRLTPYNNRRRVESITFHLGTSSKWTLYNWAEIDKQLETFKALQIVLLAFETHNHLLQHYATVPSLLPRLISSHPPKLKIAFTLEKSPQRKYTPISLIDITENRIIYTSMSSWRSMLLDDLLKDDSESELSEEQAKVRHSWRRNAAGIIRSSAGKLWKRVTLKKVSIPPGESAETVLWHMERALMEAGFT